MSAKLYTILLGVLIFLTVVAAGGQETTPRYRPLKKAKPQATPSYSYSTPVAPTPTPVEEKPTSQKGFFVGALYSTASDLQFKGDFAGPGTGYTATDHASPAFGVSGGYLLRRDDAIGVSADITLDLPRTATGVSGTTSTGAIVTGVYSGNPSYSVLSAAVNANYSLGSRFYLYGGLNFPLTFGLSGSESLTGLVGYQGGAGFVVTEKISAEFGYRFLHFKGSINAPGLNMSIDEAVFSGMILGVHYLF